MNRIKQQKCAVYLIAYLLILICASAAEAQTSLAWQKLNLQGPLAPRAYFATAYDPVSKNVVIFGGYNNFAQLDETWVYDGQNWRHAVEYVHPSARASASMVYD